MTVFSSSHTSDAAVENSKPALIEDYNFGKKRVDQMDENVEEFTSRRTLVRHFDDLYCSSSTSWTYPP